MFPFTNKEIISITNDSSLYTVQFKIKESEYTGSNWFFLVKLAKREDHPHSDQGPFLLQENFQNHTI